MKRRIPKEYIRCSDCGELNGTTTRARNLDWRTEPPDSHGDVVLFDRAEGKTGGWFRPGIGIFLLHRGAVWLKSHDDKKWFIAV